MTGGVASNHNASDLQPGDHVCCIYDTDEQFRTLLTGHLRQGLERDEKIVCAIDTGSSEMVLDSLRSEGIDVDSHLRRGQLEILARDDTYLRSSAFDQDGLFALLRSRTAAALAEGYGALRACGDMSWAASAPPGAERLMSYESKLNDLGPGTPCILLCHYDRRRFSPDVLLNALCTHPTVAVGREICRNPYYEDPVVFLSGHPAGRLEQRLRALVDRKREDERRERAEEMLEAERRLFAGGPTVIFKWKAQAGWPVEYVSPNVAAQFGYAPEELTVGGFEYAAIVHHEDLARVGAEVAAYSDQGVPSFEQMYRIARADGCYRWVHDFTTVIRGMDGGITHYHGYVRDITEHKQVEQRLRHHLEIERLVTGISTELINLEPAQVDPAITRALGIIGHFAGVDRSYVFQFSADGALHSNTHEWVAEGIAPQSPSLQDLRTEAFPWVMSRLSRSEVVNVPRVAGLPPEASPERAVFEAGEIKSLIVVPMEFGRHLIGFLGFDSVRSEKNWAEEDAALFRTVAESFVNALQHKRAQEVIRRSEDRYRSLVEDLAEGVGIMDCDERFMFSNPANDRIFGVAPGALVGRNLHDFLDTDGSTTVRAQSQLRKMGQTTSYELSIRRADEQKRVLLLTGSPQYDIQGRFVGTIAIARDMTREKQAEEQLRQAQKMEAVGQLAGGIAHDFNNLQQAMLSLIEVMRIHIGDRERMSGLLEELGNQVKRGASLSRQLLLFSRRETTKPELVELNEAIRESSKLLGRLLRENINFSLELAAAPLPVVIDRGQFDQVLLNLAINSADAMPDGGKLVIRSAAQKDEWVCFTVEDTGHGMSPEVQSHLFEPFFTTKAPNKGTGLGLSVVHGAVTQHGGMVEVESQVGVGTLFRVRLPRAPDDGLRLQSPQPASGLDVTPGRGERILIVEDEDSARRSLRDILLALGYSVEAVGSGREAQAMSPSVPFDVLLTDLLLPDVFGADLAKHLRSRWPDLRVILMSGYTVDARVRVDVESGRVRYLQKPFDIATLAAEVSAALRESRSL
ncbi:MAG: MEDS domain-containing protein [Acidobacteria bacterium]|nr:MEDS domain-containing protein [Acidobacteriota bacterium]